MSLIKASTINFNELVFSKDLSLTLTNSVVKELEENFKSDEQRWYVAQLYMYLNYHPTEDYPINLEDVYKIIGFANKGNAKRTLENNFTKEDDYKIILLPKEKKQNAGRSEEKILLNTDTFKSLCMLTKTEKAKEIRKYYVKLENIYNKIITKQLQEKNNEILQLGAKLDELKKQEISHIYIGWNPKVQDTHKIGISSDVLSREESHKSSNPYFVYLYSYETENAKIIEDYVKFFLKNHKLKKPEWFHITYDDIKKILDFCILVCEHYKIHESVDNLIHFVSRYRNNRLVNTCKSRIMVDNDIYQQYFEENIIKDVKYKTTIGMVLDDFNEWYNEKFDDKRYHIKSNEGNWSTEFTKEMLNKLEIYTRLKSKKVNVRDRMRGLNHTKCTGFDGIILKRLADNPGQIYPEEAYREYVKSNIIILDDQNRYKLSREELLHDFHLWVKNSKYPYNRIMFAVVKFSPEFIKEIIESISNITGKTYYKNLVKRYDRGCFLSLDHKNIDCKMNISPTVDELLRSS